jgi:hypothetical protein
MKPLTAFKLVRMVQDEHRTEPISKEPEPKGDRR